MLSYELCRVFWLNGNSADDPSGQTLGSRDVHGIVFYVSGELFQALLLTDIIYILKSEGWAKFGFFFRK